jgi:hypothetical protein
MVILPNDSGIAPGVCGVGGDNTELITTYVLQIEVGWTEIAISLPSEDDAPEDEKDNPLVLTVPWSKTPHRRHRDVIAPEGALRTQVLPIRSDTRPAPVMTTAAIPAVRPSTLRCSGSLDGDRRRGAVCQDDVGLQASTSEPRRLDALKDSRPEHPDIDDTGFRPSVPAPVTDPDAVTTSFLRSSPLFRSPGGCGWRARVSII